MLPGLARGALQYSTAKVVREGFPFQSRASLSLPLSGSEEENCDFFFFRYAWEKSELFSPLGFKTRKTLSYEDFQSMMIMMI